MKNFKLLTLLSLALCINSVFAENDICNNQQKLCKLRKYANKRLKSIYGWDQHYSVDMYLSRVIEQTSTAKFDSSLNEAKTAIEEDINLFVKQKQGSMDTLKTWAGSENVNCSQINSAAKTWLQLKTYFTQGHEPQTYRLGETAYERCSNSLSSVRRWKKHTAELDEQIKVLEKIKSGLDECMNSEPTAQVS